MILDEKASAPKEIEIFRQKKRKVKRNSIATRWMYYKGNDYYNYHQI